jgi:GTP pyrophosphokinase
MTSKNTAQKLDLDLQDRELQQVADQLWSELSPLIKYLPAEDQAVVELAFTQMVMSHNQDKRKSGEYYIVHPVAACKILAELKMDKNTLAAALMHDVPEDTSTTLKDLSKDFNGEIVFLIEGVTKLSKIRYQGENRYVENLRKMFVAMSKDLRVVFIKLADRLHNLRTLEHVRPDKQKRIAMESVEIYAPIAEKMGIGYFRAQIEDSCFPYLFPREYKLIVENPSLDPKKAIKDLDTIKSKVSRVLSGFDNIKLSSRVKKHYSLFKKICEKSGIDLSEVKKKILFEEIDLGLDKSILDTALSKIYDVLALRVICKDVETCYQVLGALSKDFEAIEGKAKDYIIRPKTNGYQSIHTTVKDPETGLIFELQIRTEAMHEYAEYGVASHWSYKESKVKSKQRGYLKESSKSQNLLDSTEDKILQTSRAITEMMNIFTGENIYSIMSKVEK